MTPDNGNTMNYQDAKTAMRRAMALESVAFSAVGYRPDSPAMAQLATMRRQACSDVWEYRMGRKPFTVEPQKPRRLA